MICSLVLGAAFILVAPLSMRTDALSHQAIVAGVVTTLIANDDLNATVYTGLAVVGILIGTLGTTYGVKKINKGDRDRQRADERGKDLQLALIKFKEKVEEFLRSPLQHNGLRSPECQAEVVNAKEQLDAAAQMVPKEGPSVVRTTDGIMRALGLQDSDDPNRTEIDKMMNEAFDQFKPRR
jgi:hypothetical protein